MFEMIQEVIKKIDEGEKWALIGVPGIQASKHGYVLPDLEAMGLDLNRFEEKFELDTENYFDNGIPKLLLKIPGVDKGSDVFRLLRQKQSRQDICRALRNKIYEYQTKGYKILLATHSWGTVISLICGPNDPDENKPPIVVDKFLMMGSPLGLCIWAAAVRVTWFVFEYVDHFNARDIQYLYSRFDVVSTFLWKHVRRVLEKVALNTIFISKRRSNHCIKQYQIPLSEKDRQDQYIVLPKER